MPSGLARGLGVLGPLAAGYGVYDDIQSGESTEQAVVSQGGGLLSGMVAGGATGAAIGTMGFPVAGTIVGGVVGGVTGLVVSNEIDETLRARRGSPGRGRPGSGRGTPAEHARRQPRPGAVLDARQRHGLRGVRR